MLRAIICALSLAGLADSLYFTLAYYGRIRKARWVPQILCAREGSSCVTVVQTSYARVWVPNSLLGILYYVTVMVWLSCGTCPQHRGACLCVPVPDWSTISGKRSNRRFWFLFDLRPAAELHVDCPFCYTAHAINALLFVLLIEFVL